MARKSNYHRSFIILKGGSKGYGFVPNRKPAGYCKFEIRRGIGKAYIYIQDIKPSSALDGVYEAYLISVDDSIKPCKLTSLHIDEQGRGEYMASFDADDINGSGSSLEDFHALVIAVRSEESGKNMRMSYPLIGYSSRNVKISPHKITENLKHIYGEDIKLQSQFDPEEELLESVKAERQAEVESENQEAADKVSPSNTTIQAEAELDTKEDSTIGSAEDDKKGIVPQDKVEEEQDFLNKRDPEPFTSYPEASGQSDDEGENLHKRDHGPEDLKKAYEDTYQKYLDDYSFQDKHYLYRQATYWDNVKDYFMGLFKNYKRVYPFDNDLKDVEWVRVQQTVAGTDSYYSQSPYRYPYYGSLYPDHYIVGLVKERGRTKYVVYGIPSMYSMIPPISINGFSRWASMKEGYGTGYWLLYIDAISGQVVYPYEKE